MIQFIWKTFKLILGVFLSILRPSRRLVCLVCRRQKPIEDLELVSVGSGNHDVQYSSAYDKNENLSESWDAWEEQVTIYPNNIKDQTFIKGHDTEMSSRSTGHYSKKGIDQEQEPDINFFEDMAPEVKKQPKILIRKKNLGETVSGSGLSSRFSAMSDVPLVNSELEAWQDENNAWDTEEISEDLTWQAQEAIKEKKRIERLERQMEQQKKKQKKDEMRGSKGGSLVVTRLS
ncbi:hypothetical protein Btru_010443 [Bulinus truncatus]|nr:hypothetical protein Btru_010443 [Bulinus truncatus]